MEDSVLDNVRLDIHSSEEEHVKALGRREAVDAGLRSRGEGSKEPVALPDGLWSRHAGKPPAEAARV
jgi:hypothetical protein